MRMLLTGFLINLGLGVFGILALAGIIFGYIKLVTAVFPPQAMPGVLMATAVIVGLSLVFAPETGAAFYKDRK